MGEPSANRKAPPSMSEGGEMGRGDHEKCAKWTCCCPCMLVVAVKKAQEKQKKAREDETRQRQARDRAKKAAKKERKRQDKLRFSTSSSKDLPVDVSQVDLKEEAGGEWFSQKPYSDNTLGLTLHPFVENQLPVATKESEGVDGSEVILGRGHAGIAETDTKLPRRNMRLWCEHTHHGTEGLVWKIETCKDGRKAEVEREMEDGRKEMLPIPAVGAHHHLHLKDGDTIHQRKKSTEKETHPMLVTLKFLGTERSEKETEADQKKDDSEMESEEEDDNYDPKPHTEPSFGLSLSSD